jgi:hypothetical protein
MPNGLWREVPEWERRDVTVCIAAGCLERVGDDEEPRIILCTDWRASSALGTAELKLKLRRMYKEWWCLTSGSETEIETIIPPLKNAFKEAQTIDETNICAIIRNALSARKKEKINEFIQGRYGISYDDFLHFGKDKFPSDIHREAFLSLSEIKLGCTFIFAGLTDRHSIVLIDTTDAGRVAIREDFVTIGEGAYLAQASLLQRKFNGVKDLPEALYMIYEAKKFAEEIGSVGPRTTLAIIGPDTRRDVNAEGLKKLEAHFKKFGPQKIKEEELEEILACFKPFGKK